jgi:hypothetical protein
MYIDVGVNVVLPVNVLPLTDKTDKVTVRTDIAYNSPGLRLFWNFTPTNGMATVTEVEPTTGGLHDWLNSGGGMYRLEIPAISGEINNNQAGRGWFTGFADDVLTFKSPEFTFRSVSLNNALVDGTTLLPVDCEDVPAPDEGGDTVLTAGDLIALAKGPKRVTGDEGTVEERSIKELIEADRYSQAKEAAGLPPYGMRIAKMRFPGTP